MATRPITENLFEGGAHPRLLAGQHRETGRYVFPYPAGRDAEDYELTPLAREGRLWSHTVQRFRPKSPPYTGPEAFEPYAVGYVEFDGQLIVEGRLVGLPLDGWAIGMAMRTTTITIASGADNVLLYAFEPANGNAA